MSKQMLYYEKVVPVSGQRHRDWSLAQRTSYGFAGNTNSVPLAAVEFPSAVNEYAIVFTASEEAPQPVAMLGLKSDENLYLDEDGKWTAKYIPAFVRRYPFVFSKSKQEDNKFILCIDEKYSGWNKKGQGNRLFDAQGERTEYLKKILNFVQDFQVQAARTQAFCKKLRELELLEPMKAEFKLSSGKQAALTGFLAVSREKLASLPGEKLAELAKSGELEMIYLHLQSLRNLAVLLPRSAAQAESSSTKVTDTETTGSLH